MQKVILLNEIDTIENYIGKDLIAEIKSRRIDKFENYENASLISFNWFDLSKISGIAHNVIIFFSKDDLFFICKGEDAKARVEKIFKENSHNDKVLYYFFCNVLKDDIDHLEKIEEIITQKEDELLTSSKRESANDIVSFRRKLLRLKRYYEQLNRIFEGLVENENELITKENLRFFKNLDKKVDRLFSNVLNLRDYVTQVREAYQAQIDIEQNSLMKTFTVITSVFMPLTLLVGWYGMNLKIPEFDWDYGYIFVIGLSVIIVMLCIILFKKKKWF